LKITRRNYLPTFTHQERTFKFCQFPDFTLLPKSLQNYVKIKEVSPCIEPKTVLLVSIKGGKFMIEGRSEIKTLKETAECSKRCTCEHFSYLPELALYPNCSDMNKLYKIACMFWKKLPYAGFE